MATSAKVEAAHLAIEAPRKHRHHKDVDEQCAEEGDGRLYPVVPNGLFLARILPGVDLPASSDLAFSVLKITAKYSVC